MFPEQQPIKRLRVDLFYIRFCGYTEARSKVKLLPNQRKMEVRSNATYRCIQKANEPVCEMSSVQLSRVILDF